MAKRKFKNKEQVIKDLKRNQDFAKKMEFVKTKFYPALIESSHSIDDARTFLGSFSTMIMQEFLQTMKNKKVSELGLVKMLDAKDEKYEQIKAVVELFDDASLFEAKELVEGMKAEIQLFVDEELKERPLSTVKPRWIDEIVR